MTVSETATERAEALLPLTPTVIEGPYFKLASPHRSSLLEPGITGTRLSLTGRVLTPSGRPIPRAALDFWQSDDQGNYDMVGDLLRGHVFADDSGVYRIETIMPACYEPRQARHIHVKVQGVSRPLTTQLYFSDDENRKKDNYFMQELEVQVADQPDGSKVGTFDFVIQQVTEKENVTAASLAARV